MGVFSGIVAFGRRLQSDLVLRTARGLYLIAACVSLAFLTIAVVIALLAQVSTFRFTLDEPVPAVHSPQAEPIAVSDVAARLLPPTSLRFVQDPAIITSTIAKDQPLGYFFADTPNSLASYPDDFDLIGGEGAALFAIERHTNGRAGLRATTELADRINAARAAHETVTTQSFIVRVVARDAFGLRSAPTDVTVQLSFGPAGAVAPAPTQVAAPTDLQALAREIAVVVDPSQTGDYFDVLRGALQTPRRCGANDQDQDFVVQYRRGFEFVRARLTSGNVDLFFRGVCDAWTNAAQRGLARTAQEQAAANAVLGRNLEQRMALEAQKLLATTVRNVALGVAGSALAVFLSIALFLAFLAMEGHSKALREAVEALARRSENESRYT